MSHSLEALLHEIKLYHLVEKINDPYDALSLMVQNNYDNLSFDLQLDFYINNIGVLEIDKKSKKYIYNYELNGIFDIVTNIESDLPIKVIFGSHVNDSKNLEIIKFLSMHARIFISFYIDPDHVSKHFYLKMKCYLLNDALRDKLKTSTIFTKTHKYVDNLPHLL